MIRKNLLFKSLVLCCTLFMVNRVVGQKIEFEALEIIYGDIAKGENGFRFSQKVQLDLVCSVKLSKETSEPVDVVITLSGQDQKGKKYSVSTDVAPLYKTEKFKRSLTIDASAGNNIFITQATITATDAKNKVTSATESMDADVQNKSFEILLNGLAKPPTRGKCKYGQCFVFSGLSALKPGEGIAVNLGNLHLKQTLTYNKEKNASTLDFNAVLKNYDPAEIALIKSLIIWGVIRINAKIIDDGEIGITVKHKMPVHKAGATELELFDGSFFREKTTKNRIKSVEIEITNAADSVFKLKTQYNSGYTGPTSNFHVWNEIWLIDQGVDYCNNMKIQEAFMTQSVSKSYAAVVLGLNNTKKSEPPMAIEVQLTGRRVSSYATITWQAGNGKSYDQTVPATETSEGRWLYFDTAVIKDSVPLIKAIRIYFVNGCGDSFVFEATHSVALKSGSLFERKLGGIMGKIGGKVGGTRVNAFLITPGSGISITGGSIVISDKSEFTVGGTLINVNSGNFKNQPANSNGVLKGRWDDNYSEGKSPGTWSSSRQMFEYTFSFNASKEKPVTLTGYTLYLITEKKDTIVYESTGEIGSSLDGKQIMVLLDKGEKIKYFNPCKTKYKLKEITYAETSASGIYALKVNFQLESNNSLPDSMAMIVEVKDCNGNATYVRIALKYDAKTDSYSGSQALTEIKGCSYQLIYGEIAAYNSCGDKTVWSFDATKSKSNGKGTRNVATTTNGKPNLL